MAAAQRSTQPEELVPDTTLEPVSSPDSPADDLASAPFALRQQVAERLASHRARRARIAPAAEDDAAPSAATSDPSPARSRSAHIAAAVAQRYAQSPSYRTFLAAEAERSVRHAEAAADVALINAQAIAAAQQQLLSDLEHWDPDPEDFALGPVPVASTATPNYTPLPTPEELAAAHDQALENAVRQPFPVQWSSKSSRRWTEDLAPDAATESESQAENQFWNQFANQSLPVSNGLPLLAPVTPSFTVRLYEDAPPPTPTFPERLTASHARRFPDDRDAQEGQLLDEEIAFRQDPIFDELAGEPLPLSANLLEFPRQLVAARKARPRLAEGPLREDTDTDPVNSQLRIFEVEPGQISAAPPLDPSAPEWSSILLAAHRHTDPEPSLHPSFVPYSHSHTAPVHLRLMSAFVDGAILLGTLAAFTGVFVLTVSHFSGSPDPIRIPWPAAVSALAAILCVLTVAYYVIFFTVSESTPGMRYARIALCTFNDENPTRSAMRRRLLYTVIAALPLGLGLLWAFLDEDGLGWHDRLSGMYQRSY